MEGEWKQKYDRLETHAKDRANQSMMDRQFIFKDGGQVEVHWVYNGSSKFVTGTWELNGEENLYIKIGEQTTEYTVSRPSATSLILRNSKGKGFFNSLYLNQAQ
jgi:hypothetical protein